MEALPEVPVGHEQRPQSPPQFSVPRRTRLLRKVDVRAAASTTAPVIERVRGALTVTGKVRRWVQVRTPGGTEGWVLERDVRW